MDINDPFYYEIAKALNRTGTEYILVGGLAVAYYGFHRYTGDMDLWIKSTESNMDKLYSALVDVLRYDHASIASIKKTRPIESPTPIRLFSDDEATYVDLMTNKFQKIFSWDECKQHSNEIKLKDIKFPVVHINHLIRMKENTKRLDDSMQDLVDAHELKKILKLQAKGKSKGKG
ncbi:MAG: nucleotidyltransferase [Imperialibacter sp.]|uniref:nucleotidyltransferase n=1 Tax=Imperialibacter sp. TaxID=2038411 RepID=UPI0032EB3FB5